jgi:hypothetical protein
MALEDDNIVELEQSISIKTEIGKALFDKEHPEMITKIGYEEVDKISILSALVKEENELRKEKKIEKNILQNVLMENLVLRCSLKGWRAEQGEKIITAIVDDERQEPSLRSRLSRVIRG